MMYVVQFSVTKSSLSVSLRRTKLMFWRNPMQQRAALIRPWWQDLNRIFHLYFRVR